LNVVSQPDAVKKHHVLDPVNRQIH